VGGRVDEKEEMFGGTTMFLSSSKRRRNKTGKEGAYGGRLHPVRGVSSSAVRSSVYEHPRPLGIGKRRAPSRKRVGNRSRRATYFLVTFLCFFVGRFFFVFNLKKQRKYPKFSSPHDAYIMLRENSF
jgi:hypothetical protein